MFQFIELLEIEIIFFLGGGGCYFVGSFIGFCQSCFFWYFEVYVLVKYRNVGIGVGVVQVFCVVYEMNKNCVICGGCIK